MRFSILKLFEKLIKICGSDFGLASEKPVFGELLKPKSNTASTTVARETKVDFDGKEFQNVNIVEAVIDIAITGLQTGDSKMMCLDTLSALIDTSKHHCA